MSLGSLKGKRKVVLIHHHFHRPSWEAPSVLSGLWLALENKTMKLRKKPALLRLFARIRVELVLHGHHHTNCEYTSNGILFMNGGGTVMGPDPSVLSVNLVRLDGANLRTGIQNLQTFPACIPTSSALDGEPTQIAA
jgi:predicted phosphodiesterase